MAQISTQEIREKIAEIMRDNIHFSPQLDNYVIHGAIDKIIELFQQPLPSDIISFRDEEAEKRYPTLENIGVNAMFNLRQIEHRGKMKGGFDLCHSTYVVPLQQTVDNMLAHEGKMKLTIEDLEEENKELKKTISDHYTMK